MSRERLYWGASLGAIVGYALAVLTGFPVRIFYYPHSESWRLIDLPGQSVIRWYGHMINAGLGALAGMAIMWPIRRGVRWWVVWVTAIGVLLFLAAHERHWFRR